MKKLFVFIILSSNIIFLFAQKKSIHFKNGVSDKEIVSTLPKRIVNESSNYIEMDYSFDNAEISTINQDTSVFQLFSIQGMSKMTNIGKPALPSYNDIISVPTKSGLGIKIVDATYTDYQGFYIAPAIKPQIDAKKDSIVNFKIDKSVYDKNSFYPENLAEIISIQDYREVPLAFVQIHPIQYNPKTKTIRCYSRIKYQITFTKSLKVRSFSTTPKDNFDILQNTISNSTITTESTTSSGLKSASLTSTTSRNYIIITTNDFLQAARELADWKTMLGFSCEIVSQASWTSTQVKTAISQRYTNWTPKPEYFVIIGDHENVPGQVLPEVDYGDYATDLYYACMGGTGDYTPDMAHGRISVTTLDQAYTVIRKIINYERNPITNSAFYSNGVNCAQFQDDAANGYEDRGFTYCSETIRNYMLTKGYTINRVYYTDNAVMPRYYSSYYGNGQAIPAELRKDVTPFYPWTGSNTNITSEINSGKFFVFHRDHGGYSGWGRPSYNVNDINNLNNSNLLPVVFSINCQTGGFLQPECFAEKFLRYSNGGAVGVFGASQVSYSGYNDALAVGMFDAIWSSPGLVATFGGGVSNPSINAHSDIYQMGKVLNQGLLRMGQTWGVWDYQNEIFHYFGDPAMEMYTAAPSSFSGVTVSENGTSVTVNTGISNCKVTICSLLDMGATCYEVANNVSSYTFNSISKPYYITVTKHNYKPYIYPQDIYIQNYIFTQDRLIVGRNIYVGNNVTSSVSQGPVIIKNGANVTFSAEQDVLLDKGFEAELGGTFEIEKRP